MQDEDRITLIKGIRWLPIYEKALEIHEEFEKRNDHDLFYKMGLSDILYYALALFHDDIISHEGDVHDLIKNIREEFITSQEKNVRFMMEFGELEKKFEDNIEEMRMKRKYGEWKIRDDEE